MSDIESRVKDLVNNSITCTIERVGEKSREQVSSELIEVKEKLKILNKKHREKNIKFSEMLERSLAKHRKSQLENQLYYLETKANQSLKKYGIELL